FPPYSRNAAADRIEVRYSLTLPHTKDSRSVSVFKAVLELLVECLPRLSGWSKHLEFPFIVLHRSIANGQVVERHPIVSAGCHDPRPMEVPMTFPGRVHFVAPGGDGETFTSFRRRVFIDTGSLVEPVLLLWGHGFVFLLALVAPAAERFIEDALLQFL